ncbi:MAG: hypothetical protein MI922_07555 [Bacteroidales bacterium]|nr:hypothetical protein [Bacteroidales bacterium]
MYNTIESIQNLLSSHMIQSNVNTDVLGILSDVMAKSKTFISFINVNNDFLFPDIETKESSNRLNTVLKQIIRSLDEFRKNIEDLNNSQDEIFIENASKLFLVNWHNSTKKCLDDLISVKYDFYKDLQKYLMHEL